MVSPLTGVWLVSDDGLAYLLVSHAGLTELTSLYQLMTNYISQLC